MRMILGILFMILVFGFIIGFILPAVFTIAITALLIYVIYRLIKWFDNKYLNKDSDNVY